MKKLDEGTLKFSHTHKWYYTADMTGDDYLECGYCDVQVMSWMLVQACLKLIVPIDQVMNCPEEHRAVIELALEMGESH